MNLEEDFRLVIITIKHQKEVFQVDIEEGRTVAELKEKLEELIILDSERQRLIYNGRILKDSDLVDDLSKKMLFL
jgi:hypothetical protein